MWIRWVLASCLLAAPCVAKGPQRGPTFITTERKGGKTVKVKPPKRQMLMFSPSIASDFRGLGFSYRLEALEGFYDIALSYKKMPAKVPSNLFPEGARDQTQYLYENSFSLGRALSTDFQYVNPYVLGGVGLTHIGASSEKLGEGVAPTGVLKVGLTCNYGFYDIGVTLPLTPLRYKLTATKDLEKGVEEISAWQSSYWLPSQRIGIGFTF